MGARQRFSLILALALLAAPPLIAAEECGADCSSIFFPELFRACLLNVSSSAIFPDTDYEAWDEARRCGPEPFPKLAAAAALRRRTRSLARLTLSAFHQGLQRTYPALTGRCVLRQHHRGCGGGGQVRSCVGSARDARRRAPGVPGRLGARRFLGDRRQCHDRGA